MEEEQQSLVQTVKEAIDDLDQEEATVIDQIDWRSYHFLVALRAVLLHRLKEGSFLPLVAEVTPRDTADYIVALPSLDPSVFSATEERELAWLALSLNEGMLSCYLRVLGDNPEMCRPFYDTGSIVPEGLQPIIDMIEGLLSKREFRLDLREYARYRHVEQIVTSEPERPVSPIPRSLTGSIVSRHGSPGKGGGVGLAVAVDLDNDRHGEQLIGSPRTAEEEAALKEFKAVVEEMERTTSAPVIVVDGDEEEHIREPHSSAISGSEASGEWSTRSTSTESSLTSQVPSILVESLSPTPSPSLFTLVSQFVKERLVGRQSEKADFSSNPIDRGLIAQSFQCAACSDKITSATANFCPMCGLYKCVNCTSEQSIPVIQRILLNWDFTESNCCRDCTEGYDADVKVDASSVLLQAVDLDENLSRALESRLILPMCQEIIVPCIDAPEVESEFDGGNVMIRELIEWHRTGTDSLITAVHEHLSGCQDCRGRGPLCCVCGEDGPLIPLIAKDARFCSTCFSAWHADCESHCPKC